MYFPFGAVLGRLPQLLIFRAGLDQILMLSCRNQFAVVYDADLIGVHNRGQLMGDDHQSLA